MSLPEIKKPIFTEKFPAGGDFQFRPYDTLEQKSLLVAATGDDGTGNDLLRNLVELVNACTFNKFDFKKQTVARFEKAMLAIRSKSVSESVELGYRCKNTVTNDQGVEVDCNHRNFIDIPYMKKVEFTPEPNPIIKIDDNVSIKLIPLFMEDVLSNIDIDDPKMFRSKVEWVSNGEDIITEFSDEEFAEWIKGIPVSPAEEIVKYFNSQSAAVLNIPVKCKKCGCESSITIQGAVNFFG